VHLKELENVYQNTSNEPLFYLIRNDVHIKFAFWFVTGNLSVMARDPCTYTGQDTSSCNTHL